MATVEKLAELYPLVFTRIRMSVMALFSSNLFIQLKSTICIRMLDVELSSEAVFSSDDTSTPMMMSAPI